MNRSCKKILLLVTLCLTLSILVLTACNQTIDSLGIRLKLDKRELSNGLTVIMVEDHSVPVITYQSWYRVGSVDEVPGLTGISHMFEHLMFKGTAKYGPRQFFHKLESKGAEVNAYTTRDYTVFYESFAPDLLEQVIDMEADRVMNLVITDEILSTERLVVLEERRLRAENAPEGKILEALWQLAYRQHPYHWPVMGIPADLLHFTTDHLKEYYKKYYRPSNLAVVIVGNFDADQTFQMIKKQYEKLPKLPRPERKIYSEPQQSEERRFVIRERIPTERFAHGYHVTSASDDDSYALDVLANILFEGKTSRAYHALVEKKGILEAVSGSAYTPTYPGLFIINGILKKGHPISEAESQLDALIDQVQESGVSEEEVKTAVKQLTVQTVTSVRTPLGLGQLIGTVQMTFDNPKRFSEDISKYTKVTVQDVKRVALKYLNPNNRSSVEMVVSK
jgi:zinc protease